MKRTQIYPSLQDFAIAAMNAKIKQTLHYSEELATVHNYSKFSADLGEDVSCDIITSRSPFQIACAKHERSYKGLV